MGRAVRPGTPGTSAGPPVRLRVGDAAVARLAAARARQVPGVVALRPDLARALLAAAGSVLGLDGSTTLPAEGVSADVTGSSARVAVTVVTRLGTNCRDLARAVQEAVVAELAEQAGIAATVEVTVADVLLG